MRLRTCLYLLRQGVDNIFSNRLIHSISVGTIAVSLILLGAFLLLLINMNQWMQEWGQSLSVSVYLEDNIDEEARKAIRDRLDHLPGAEITAFISKETAKKELMEALSNQGYFLELEGGMDQVWMVEAVTEMVAKLPPRERRIIEGRYGLAGERVCRLKELGAELGLTAERIRQLEEEALAWLRHPAHSVRVRTLMDRNRAEDYREALKRNAALRCA